MFKKIQTSVGDVLDFPPDVAGEGPKITITGREQILVENYFSIVNFSEEEIRLETAKGDLFFRGKGLVLKVILATELRIEGELSSLSFGGER
ncbi:YabP/YqfC family sporulation protein [Desulfosporosinus sp. BICA1-9]|uniref:YabP/YqfC family sporulation protein n=1 Tax=Desulfosporosinus sp. BICA1-9 TaxID=1531958 RepID=UPI00054C3748|nr:YabP/YqfC family sporulation protein [Desulfosporosinus sp. BICA1-9]KJS47519.1 MAG: sporulation protein [Peptococcaceae bacterium BRH_c23]KJS87256.1 MAG: sporulation protein [Desulfosporosinus sp. BICA1-9]HBW38008.1 sporulation protein [Desulfosporosinus sp.]